MALSDMDSLKKNLQEFCKNKEKRIQFIKSVNGRRNYIELAKECGIATSANCIPLIKEAEGLELTVKNPKTNLPDKCPILKGKNIDSLLRGVYNKKCLSIRPRNVTDLTITKKDFKKYALSNFQRIENYFDTNNFVELKVNEIEHCITQIIAVLEDKTKSFEIEGLELRFFTAFAEYFNETRAEPHKMLNKFSSIVKLYEPFLKKFMVIKTKEEKWFKSSINEDMLKLAYGITDGSFDVKEMNEDYWKKRSPKESSIRIAFRFRNIESHSATHLKSFEMDKIVYYIIASIILLFK